MMPAPITMTSAFRPTPISVFPRQRIAFVEQQLAIGAHIGLPANKGGNAIAIPAIVGLKLAADHAGLPPLRVRRQLAFRCQTRQFGTGAGAARGAIIGFAGAQHEAAAVGLRIVTEQFDMVYRSAVFTADARLLQRLPHRR